MDLKAPHLSYLEKDEAMTQAPAADNPEVITIGDAYPRKSTASTRDDAAIATPSRNVVITTMAAAPSENVSQTTFSSNYALCMDRNRFATSGLAAMAVVVKHHGGTVAPPGSPADVKPNIVTIQLLELRAKKLG